jgi:hypothetical protein
MINYTIEYIMCYKEAFALGVATGLLLGMYFFRKFYTYN